ncbi:lipocalin family protein [Chryseobacterium arthrosphaerae]|uniref:lipocalin family protein n=1 Tax=Chryseobacterium arthrosphaerae TaxID=651561 RepID=UPI0023E1703C|nr:lipocalin family protein [Chryseobacterium arthrosphaerae]WES99339.1 lipocalin family protein [Chryseobacterium arthrosphaerae]
MMIKMIGSTAILLAFSALMSAQKLKKENVTGFWKLKESGFYENKTRVKKDFDNCLLMRNYTLRDDGFAIYNYIEGSTGNCLPSEPRLSLWKIVDNRIQFYIGKDTIIEEVMVSFNKDNTMTFSSYIPRPVKDKDPKLEKVLNMIHYDVLEKQY